MEQFEESPVTGPSDIGVVTVEEVKQMIERLSEERLRYDIKKAELSKQGEAVDTLEGLIISTLESLNLKSFKSDIATVDIAYRTSVKLPQDQEREKFFAYLKEIGAFDALISVNSNTLNGWYKKEAEKASKEHRLLRIPGLDMPTTSPILKMRKA